MPKNYFFILDIQISTSHLIMFIKHCLINNVYRIPAIMFIKQNPKPEMKKVRKNMRKKSHTHT